MRGEGRRVQVANRTGGRVEREHPVGAGDRLLPVRDQDPRHRDRRDGAADQAFARAAPNGPVIATASPASTTRLAPVRIRGPSLP
jgi:hypothetical protein